jgi:hypothetical protein
VGELQTFADSCKHDEVVTHYVAPAKGMGSDLSCGTLAGDPLATVGDVGIYQASRFLENFQKAFGGTAGGILFVTVVHFYYFGIEIGFGVEDFGRLLSEVEEEVDAG